MEMVHTNMFPANDDASHWPWKSPLHDGSMSGCLEQLTVKSCSSTGQTFHEENKKWVTCDSATESRRVFCLSATIILTGILEEAQGSIREKYNWGDEYRNLYYACTIAVLPLTGFLRLTLSKMLQEVRHAKSSMYTALCYFTSWHESGIPEAQWPQRIEPICSSVQSTCFYWASSLLPILSRLWSMLESKAVQLSERWLQRDGFQEIQQATQKHGERMVGLAGWGWGVSAVSMSPCWDWEKRHWGKEGTAGLQAPASMWPLTY